MSKVGSHLSWTNQPSFLEIIPELFLVTVTHRQQVDFLSCAVLVTRNRCLDGIGEIRLPALGKGAFISALEFSSSVLQ
nr:unnamed protein product [Callosobruchus analis]